MAPNCFRSPCRISGMGQNNKPGSERGVTRTRPTFHNVCRIRVCAVGVPAKGMQGRASGTDATSRPGHRRDGQL